MKSVVLLFVALASLAVILGCKEASTEAVSEADNDWAEVILPDAGRIDHIFAQPDQNLLWATGTSQIYRSADNGENWEIFDNLPTARRMDFVPVDEYIQLASVAFEGIYRSTNGGLSWYRAQQFDFGYNINLYHLNTPTVLAPSEPGSILRSNDKGTTWQEIELERDVEVRTFAALPDGSFLMGTADEGNQGGGYLFASGDLGLTWKLIQQLDRSPQQIVVNNDVVLIGAWDLLLSRDGGTTLTTVLAHENPNILYLPITTSGNAYAAIEYRAEYGFLDHDVVYSTDAVNWNNLEFSGSEFIGSVFLDVSGTIMVGGSVPQTGDGIIYINREGLR